MSKEIEQQARAIENFEDIKEFLITVGEKLDQFDYDGDLEGMKEDIETNNESRMKDHTILEEKIDELEARLNEIESSVEKLESK